MNEQRESPVLGDKIWATKDSRATQSLKSGSVKGQQRTRGSKGLPKKLSENQSASWDSCERLAKEALHIGEILGIKVVKNKKAAIAEIAESIGRKKVKKSIPKQTISQN